MSRREIPPGHGPFDGQQVRIFSRLLGRTFSGWRAPVVYSRCGYCGGEGLLWPRRRALYGTEDYGLDYTECPYCEGRGYDKEGMRRGKR